MADLARLASICGDRRNSFIATLSLSMTWAGVPIGATTPAQKVACRVGNPLSVVVGTAGTDSLRASSATARARRPQVSAARPESLGGGIHQRVWGLWHSAAAPAARPDPSTGQAPARPQADRRSPTCAYHSGAQGV